MIRRLVLPLILLLSALALAACGSSESDEDKVVDVIETAATSNDPADCKALLTVAFLEQVEGSEGQEAIEECEEDAEDEEGNPDSVEVTEVEVEGAEGAADAEFVGGDFDGQTIRIGVVEEDGEWKMNQIEEFVAFDRDKFLGGIAEGFEDAEGQEAEIGECLLEGLEEFEDGELEELVVSGEGEETFVELAEEC